MRVLVTGGSRGIGKSIVDIFIKNGHDVWSPDRKELNLDSDKIHLLEINFDIIINNAGINILNNILEIEEIISMRVNYFSPLQIVRQIIPYMIKKKIW